jgi:cell wall-associated NlpC family hydrolase
MKHLFFVAVAVGIFPGTLISAKAQSSVNTVKAGNSIPAKKSTQFIEGIEIKRDATASSDADLWTVPVKKTLPVTAANTKAAVIATSNNTAVTIESSSSLHFKYAQLLDVEVETITNTKLFAAIEDWWATRYRYGGTTKKGIDCSAFTGTLMNEAFGLSLPRTAREQYAQCEKIAKENLAEGDLVFFNTRGGVSHVGVYLGNSYFVHSSVHSGVTINSLDDDYYSRKYIGGGKVITQ